MQLTKNFTLQELTRTSTGLPNNPNGFELSRLQILADALQTLRDAVGKPVKVSSGYRSPEVNRAVGGSKTSAHLDGDAADIRIDGMTNAEIIDLIFKLGIKFDQVIDEKVGGAEWVHISTAPRLRGQYLRYRNGKYTEIKTPTNGETL